MILMSDIPLVQQEPNHRHGRSDRFREDDADSPICMLRRPTPLEGQDGRVYPTSTSSGDECRQACGRRDGWYVELQSTYC
jgi:hypothetical protein